MSAASITSDNRRAGDALDEGLRLIERHDRSVGAFVDLRAEDARGDASALDDELAAGRSRGPLHGVPIAVKELFDVAEADGSYGSAVLAGRRATEDAAVVAALRRAGAVVVGTARAHEFGWGITTQHAMRGSTNNPWDVGRIPGGSSGGSAAAVAVGMVPLAVASDTGGSVRIPASFCGVFGLKTTPGRISRRGGVALAPSFDTVGFVAREPALLAAALAATAGRDPSDPPTLDAPAVDLEAVDDTLSSTRIAVPDIGPTVAPTAAHQRALDTIAAALVDLGCRQVDVAVPSGPEMYDVFVPLQMAEAHHVHHVVLDTYPRHADLYGSDVRRRLEMAAEVTIGHYLDAQRRAAEVRARYLAAFDSAELIVTLVSSTGPSTTEQPDVVDLGGRTLPLRDVVMPYTVPQNVAGLPSITVPAGADADGLPIGVQIVGSPWSEGRLLNAAEALHRSGASRVSTPARFAGEA
jgi:aspartyl-tRNA(Asn)/glutamyl-tRNA(Gln) amidotransferase subunit A